MIGFDGIFDLMKSKFDYCTSFPPYNMKQDGDNYSLEVALAGFKKDDIEVSIEKDVLTVNSVHKKEENKEDEGYIHRGIAARQFGLSFSLNDIEVKSAKFEDGLLKIEMVKNVPEQKKKKVIEIT
jgi:molecular chaperone IbpA